MKHTRSWLTALILLLVPLLVGGGLVWGTSRADAGLKGVQAAIVNNDEMVTVNGQVMPLGRQLAAELADRLDALIPELEARTATASPSGALREPPKPLQ